FDLSPAESRAAKQVAIRVGKILSPFKGYLGVDMILTSVGQRVREASRVEGWVVEINPRLTSSYIGLRQVVDCNLAAIMLGLANPGLTVESSRSSPLEFFV
ncbi:MAG: ATP-grasp domain-containing protein, partial [Pirellulaceae bacterium]